MPFFLSLPLAVMALALASQIAVPLPFSPVPLTLQSLAVLLVGAAFGPWRSAMAVSLWLLLAAGGLPLLSDGSSGIGGPTTGYLIAMPLAAALAGWHRSAMAMLAAHALILAFGALWLSASIGPAAALAGGVWPFLPGALIKSFVAAWLAPRLRPAKTSANKPA